MATKNMDLVLKYVNEKDETKKLAILNTLLMSKEIKMIVDYRVNKWYEFYGATECDYYTITKEDLFQEAQLGVLEALGRFVAEKSRHYDDKSFYNFASKYVMGHIRKYICANTRFGTATEYYCAQLVKMKNAGLELSSPTDLIAAKINIPVKTVEKMRDMFTTKFDEYASMLSGMTTELISKDEELKDRLQSLNASDREFAEDAFFLQYEPKDLRVKYNMSLKEVNALMRKCAMRLFPEYKNYIPKTDKVIEDISAETMQKVHEAEVKELIIHYNPAAVNFTEKKWAKVMKKFNELVADSTTIKREHQSIALRSSKEK